MLTNQVLIHRSFIFYKFQLSDAPLWCLLAQSALQWQKRCVQVPKGHMSKKKIWCNITLWFPSVNILFLNKVLLKGTLKCSITNSPLLLDKPCVNIAYPCLTNFPAVWHALSSGDLLWYSVHVRGCCSSHGAKWLQKSTQINMVSYWTLQIWCHYILD